LQLPPNSSLQSIRGTVLAAGAVPWRWRSALLGAAELHVRYAAQVCRRILVSEDHAIATLVLHGAIVFFVGMLAGLPYGVLRARGGTPESLDNWRVAHVQNLQNGFLLLIVGACTRYLEL
jgi:hypothetical protein